MNSKWSSDSIGMKGAPPAMNQFIGEHEHRIHLSSVREELGCIGPLHEPHGDLRGYRVLIGRGRLWPRSASSALSFPASLLIGPVFDDGVPF